MPWRATADGVEVMLITSRDTQRWVLPKGWPEADEALCDAAAREAGEEAGLRGKVARQEIGRYHYDKVMPSGRGVPCEVFVYSLRVDRVAAKWREKGQRRRKWVTPEEAAGMVRETELSALLSAFAAPRRKSA